jgi:uncharacterized protein
MFRAVLSAVVLVMLAIGLPLHAADAPKRILLVTHSGGFVHNSVVHAEAVLKKIGPAHGFEVTCWRFTNDPDAKVKVQAKKDEPATEMTALEAYSQKFRGSTGAQVTSENCGRINKETLKNFDCVVFFTTGNPVNKEELVDLLDWVKAGGAFAGTHCATDTLYNTTYGGLIGGYFDGHPWHQKVTLKVEKGDHPAAAGFKTGDVITDEIYQFKNWSREDLDVLISIDNNSIDTTKGKRDDKDYAVSWTKTVGNGRVFYTSLGHRNEVWDDPRFQTHLIAGLKWAMAAKSEKTTSGQE